MPRHVHQTKSNSTRFVMVSPATDDVLPELDALHVAPRPGTDTALMPGGLAHEPHRRGRVDHDFLTRYCSGGQEFLRYLEGVDDAEFKALCWAARIADIPLDALERLADLMMQGTVMLTDS